MRQFWVLVLLVGLGACVQEPGLESRMASYTGASEQTLVQRLGVPDKQVTVGGVQYLAYEERDLDVSPGFVGPAFGGGYGGGFWGGPFYNGFGPGPFFDAGIPARVNEVSCETTFMLRDDKVIGFTLRGGDCT